MKRTRKAIREEIIESVSKTKNSFYLSDILNIAEIFRKMSDEKEYQELKDIEYDKAYIIRNILNSDNAQYIRHINLFIRALNKQ